MSNLLLSLLLAATNSNWRGNKLGRGEQLTRLLLPLLLFIHINITAQDNPTPFAQRGPYAVGTRETTIDDIPMTVWYPANSDGGTPESTTYRSGLLTAEGLGQRDADIDEAQAPYPLVVFSHGSGASRLMYVYLLEHLASYGFIVAAPEHVGNSVLDTIRTATFIETTIEGYVSRPEDVHTVIEHMPTLFGDFVDMKNITLMGHSFGGYTALAAVGGQWDFYGLEAWCDEHAGGEFDPYPDEVVHPNPASPDMIYGVCFMQAQRPQGDLPDPIEHIQALVLLAPWNGVIWGEEGLRNIDAPTLIMAGTADTVTPYERDAQRIYGLLGNADDSRLMTFDDAGHYIFMDECPPLLENTGQSWSCTDPVWTTDEAHETILSNVTAFLRGHLLDDDKAYDYWHLGS